MRRVLAAAALAVTAAACASPAKPAADVVPETEKIAWGPCTDIVRPDGEPPARQDPAVRCGKLAVPLDYGAPDGEKIDLALIKIAATDKKRRIGSLLFNFGGPGGSGVDTLDQAAKSLSTLRARYDLVSFDPRGVERSSGVRCGGPADLDAYTALNTLPADEETRAKTDAANKSSPSCARRTRARSCRTSAPSTPPATWTASAPRWARRSSTTSACRTARSSAPSTPPSSPATWAGWCSTRRWTRRSTSRSAPWPRPAASSRRTRAS